LQNSLSPKALLIEYVLAEPNSYALTITRDSVVAYQCRGPERRSQCTHCGDTRQEGDWETSTHEGHGKEGHGESTCGEGGRKESRENGAKNIVEIFQRSSRQKIYYAVVPPPAQV
jgi:hypothetical protein